MPVLFSDHCGRTTFFSFFCLVETGVTQALCVQFPGLRCEAYTVVLVLN